MPPDEGPPVARGRGGRSWRIGCGADVAWIEQGVVSGLAITSAIPPLFEAYATLELPLGDAETQDADAEERHDAAVPAVLREHTLPQPWWLGYLDTGANEIPFGDAPRVALYANWPYVVIEAGPKEAAAWRPRWDYYKGSLPDLMFPAGRSWLVSTLWDDDWTCIGGSQTLIDAFLRHPDLARRVRQVALSDEDATPPGHEAI